MSIFGSKKSQRTTENAPADWRTDPGVAAHRAKLDARRAQLGDLQRTYSHAAQELERHEQALQHAELLRLAGRGDASAVEEAQRQRDAAKSAHAVAKLDYDEAVRECDLLEARLPEVTETVRRETAAQHVEQYRALMADFKAKLEAAIEANEALYAQYLATREQYADGTFTDGWPLGLGLMAPSWPDLRQPRNVDGMPIGYAYERWLEEYERWVKERHIRAAPSEPGRIAQQSDPVANEAPAPMYNLPPIPGLSSR